MKTYKITGIKWSKQYTYYAWDKDHEYPMFSAEDTLEVEKQFESLYHAHLWMLENIPSYAIGCNVRCLENSDFVFDCVKGHYVSILRTEDEEAIIAFIKRAVRERIKRGVRA